MNVTEIPAINKSHTHRSLPDNLLSPLGFCWDCWGTILAVDRILSSKKICSGPNPHYLWIWLYLAWGLYRCNQVKVRSDWVRVGPSAMAGILRREKFGHRRYRKENHLKTEAEIRVMCLQAKKQERLLGTPWPRRGAWNRFSFRASRRN